MDMGMEMVLTDTCTWAVHSVPVLPQALRDLLALKYICLISAKSVV